MLVRAPSFTSSTSKVAGPAAVRRMKENWSEIGEAGLVYCFGWACSKCVKASLYKTADV